MSSEKRCESWQGEEAVSRATALLGTRKSLEEIPAGICSAQVVLLTEHCCMSCIFQENLRLHLGSPWGREQEVADGFY